MMQVKPEAFDDLRTAVAKVDALAAAAEQAFDNAIWPPGADRQQVERIAHLVGASRETAESALCAVDALNADALDPTVGSAGSW
jgi:hypothetical protein